MTVGEKITLLRSREEISQETLAEKLSVSRQAISSWEINQSLPSVDNILKLCEIFGISTDELLKNESSPKALGARNKYFGTDGFRGEANISLTVDAAFKVGRFLGWYYTYGAGRQSNLANYRAKIVIGKDTRRSSYMLEYALVAGITASGADAYMLHVTTTPSVSYVTRADSFDCGIMITASHNPFTDNGIKVINRNGEKLEDSVTALIEAYLDSDMRALGIADSDLPLAKGEKIGLIVDYTSGRNRYIAYLVSLASHSYKNLRIGIDCANGASWSIARAVFGALGAHLEVIGAEPDGLNINRECGSTKPEVLAKLVRERGLDIGFSFDGDADRCIAVDESGRIVDGDAIMYVLAKRLKSRGMLGGNTVVATVMSNSGFVKSLKREGIKCEQTQVGDRFVYERIKDGDFALGGEQSGHIIIKKYATTGDGILTAIMICEELCDRKSKLGELYSALTVYPQYTKNIRVGDKERAISDPEVLAELKRVEELIGDGGRALLRKSGTEPLIRIMIECDSVVKCEEYAERIADSLTKGGHKIG